MGGQLLFIVLDQNALTTKLLACGWIDADSAVQEFPQQANRVGVWPGLLVSANVHTGRSSSV